MSRFPIVRTFAACSLVAVALAGIEPGTGASSIARAEEAPPAPVPAPAAPSVPLPSASVTLVEEHDVHVPMRDGTWLAADVRRPAAEGRYPAIVVQTPYDRRRMGREFGDVRAGGEAARGSAKAMARLDRAHYAWVFVDWRGFFGSREAMASVDRRTWRRGLDGFDVVEWVAAQPWCDGKVGTWGGSALGKQQLDTAAERPPHLVCAVPLIAAMGQRYEHFYEGGVFLEAHAKTLDSLGFGVLAPVRAAPSPTAPAWAVARASTYHPERIDVPCLFVSGWWDNTPREVLETYEDVVAHGGERARAATRLVMGPWSHTAIDVREQGDTAFPAAEGFSTELTQRFLDRHLRGLDDGFDATPRVRLFQAGEERWVEGERVTDLLGTATPFHLRADLTIDREPLPDAGPLRPTRTYRYDPREPVPTIGGRNLPPLSYGPKDEGSLAGRADVLAWSSAALGAPVALRGEAEASFVLLCDRVDVDLSLRLCDAFPDGRMLLVGETIRRASLRGDGEPRPLRIGEPFAMRLRLPPHAWTFAAGHRIVALVTSGNSPRYERNTHTGAPRWDEATAKDVTVTVLVGAGDATLTLPLVASGPGR